MDTAPAAPQGDAPKPATAPAAQPAAAPDPAAAAPAPEPTPERTFTQKELDEIVEKRLAKERRKREDLKREAEVLRRLALQRGDEPRPQPQAPQPQQPQGEPTRDQYPDMPYEDFVLLRAEWRAERKVDAKIKEREAADRQQRAQAEQAQAGEQFRKRVKETAGDLADFEEVMSNLTQDHPAARIAADPIANAEAPGKLLYHLATHPEEAERIASLPLGQQAREVWKLEQKLSAPAPQATPSKAPEPIKPVAGKASVGDEMPDPAKNPNEWMKWRQRQLQAKRAPVRA